MNRSVVLLCRPKILPISAAFTAEQIADALGSPLENVLIQWPLVLAALERRGIADRPVQIAALANIAMETKRFLPIEEYRNADGSIPYYWHGYGGGWVYHGRGLIQITHDSNYRAAGDALGIDLVGNPQRALEPWVSAEVLAWYFATHGGPNRIPDEARAGNWDEVRRLVNGGYARIEEYRGYIRALDALR